MSSVNVVEYTTTLNLQDNPVEAVWRINPPSVSFQTVDVTLRPAAKGSISSSHAEFEDKPHQFLRDCIHLATSSPRSLKLILPAVDGFVGRGNLFERRLLECPFAERVQGFLTLDQRAGPPQLSTPMSDCFDIIVSSAAAGILLQSSASPDAAIFSLVDAELSARLALNWMLPSPAPHRNVVLVEGYSYLQNGVGFIQAVKDLNVSVIVLGTGAPHGPKHWLQNPENAPGFCEAFIPIDMAIDDDLPERIVAAVRGYTAFDRVDGILTGHDRYLVSTAKAAVILGLPASPVRTHEIATDKYAMRRFEVESQGSDFQFFHFPGFEDMKQRLTAVEDPAVVRYPAIVKPVSGYLSEGVARVSNAAELLASVARIDTKRHGHAVIVETYVDGPEFDANIVLCEGEILFFELVDDFPSAGDNAEAGAEGTFFETSEFTPSNLPLAEREIVQKSLHKTLLGLGFTWGLFHVEGRVKDSTMEFRADASGIVDLRLRVVSRTSPPSCFLVEINARIPGLGCAMSTIHSYGVDFYAAHLLSCLRDSARLRLVASPFHFPGRPDGSQYWCEVVFIQPDRGGQFNSEDPCGELLQRHPALAANVSRQLCCYAKGEIIPDPATGVCLLLAYFLAYSRKSRQHVREVSEMIRAEFRYEIV
ncbi:ATP-grasp domain-containing protein [Mycena rosella]|uniref:ATP-grasp domain-containing protein n=1 Tax=Mycena rosella TaxID=1033263 RepID=A0AAD7DJM6_MYCRO|nr:ATP-grasp domain-containing protein [Mycena rosella]